MQLQADLLLTSAQFIRPMGGVLRAVDYVTIAATIAETNAELIPHQTNRDDEVLGGRTVNQSNAENARSPNQNANAGARTQH